MISFQKLKMEMGKITIGHMTNTTSTRWSTLTSVGVNHVENATMMWCDKNSTLPMWSPSPKPLAQASNGKNIRKISRQGQSTKYLTNTPQMSRL